MIPIEEAIEALKVSHEAELASFRLKLLRLEQALVMANRATNGYANERADLISWGFWTNPNDPKNFEELDRKRLSYTSLSASDSNLDAGHIKPIP